MSTKIGLSGQVPFSRVLEVGSRYKQSTALPVAKAPHLRLTDAGDAGVPLRPGDLLMDKAHLQR